MKPSTRTRVDRFESFGNYCRVFGRKDHVLSTEVQIEKEFAGVVKKVPGQAVIFDTYFPDTDIRTAHVEPAFDNENDAENDQTLKSFSLQLNDFPVNKSIGQCDFRPLTCENHLNVRPREQVTLLPYLCEETIQNNHKYRVPETLYLNYTDAAGNQVDAPDNTRSFAYYPTEQGLFFITRQHHSEVIVDDEKLDDEKEIFESVVAQTNHWDANLISESIRFITKETQISLDGDVQVPGAADQNELLSGLPLTRVRKLIDGKYYNVYRSNFKQYFFRIDAKYFEYGNMRAVHYVNPNPDPASLFVRFEGDYVFNLSYDIEIGPFDSDGFAETRAVDFSGNDITNSVSKHGFLEMELWDLTAPVHRNGTVVLCDQAGNAQAGVATALEDLIGNPLKQLFLHLPIRRYALTARHATLGNPLNDAQFRGPTQNYFLKVLKANSDLYKTTTGDTQDFVGGDIRSQFALMMMKDRDLNDGLAVNHYATTPRKVFNIQTVNAGRFEPIFEDAGDLRTRELTGLRAPLDSIVGKRLDFIRGLADVPQTEVLALRIARTRKVQDVVRAPPLAPPQQKIAAVPIAEGWYPNQADAATVVGDGTRAIFEDDPGSGIILLFLKASIAVAGEWVNIGGTAKYMHFDNRFFTQATATALGATGNQGKIDSFNAGSYRFRRPSELAGFSDFAASAIRTFGTQNGVGDIRLSETTAQDPGYLVGIADGFYDTRSESQNADGTWNLEPDEDLSDVLDLFNFAYGATAPNIQPYFLYTIIEGLPNVDQPDGVGNIPWVLPAVPDPLPPGYNSQVNPFTVVGDPYPAVQALADVQAHYQPIQTANADPLYYEIRDMLRGEALLQYIPNDFFAENQPIARSTMTCSLQEPLLGFCGMCQFQPDKIFPMVTKLPPAIQDYELRMSNLKVNQYYNFSPQVDNDVFLELTPKENYELEIYSTDIFDQTEKALQKVDIQYPNIMRFQASGAQNLAEVEFESARSTPDFVFLYLERAQFRYPPVINTISLEFFDQDVKTISSLTQTQLYNATRRNSNYRSDLRENRKHIGGVLLSRTDFGNWSRYKNFTNTDNFRGKFIIKYSTIDESVIDEASTLEKTYRSAAQVTAKLLFVYENYGLAGQNHNMRFWYK